MLSRHAESNLLSNAATDVARKVRLIFVSLVQFSVNRQRVEWTFPHGAKELERAGSFPAASGRIVAFCCDGCCLSTLQQPGYVAGFCEVYFLARHANLLKRCLQRNRPFYGPARVYLKGTRLLPQAFAEARFR